ncbi:MAG: lyase family protein, partial [Planctomycetota bacterium]
RLYKYDIAGSIAHAQMLAEQKLITKEEYKQIKNGLLEISREIGEGKFEFDAIHEDIHMAIEAALVGKIGEAGKKLHTGRSRNDQVAADVRLWMRDKIEDLQGKLRGLQKAFVKRAEKYSEDVMPAYTHMQRAQPVVIGAYLLSFVESLERDFVRLGNCSRGLNVSPLGSGAVAGSTLGIDCQSTAKQLGFSDISRNSIDAVSDRDFCAEFIFDCSLIAVRIEDSYCTSSSMMPQKRNPDVPELIRGKAGGVYGSLMAMLTILKAQPTGYNRDLQEDKVHIFSASDAIESMLDMATAVLLHTKFNVKKIASGLDEGFLDATSLVEYLVGRGAAFREAHGIVGSLVASCEKAGTKLIELSLDEFREYSSLISENVYEWLGAARVSRKYITEGAGGPRQVKKQIAYWQKRLAEQ